MAGRDTPNAGGKRRREKCYPTPVFGMDPPVHKKAAPKRMRLQEGSGP